MQFNNMSYLPVQSHCSPITIWPEERHSEKKNIIMWSNLCVLMQQVSILFLLRILRTDKSEVKWDSLANSRSMVSLPNSIILTDELSKRIRFCPEWAMREIASRMSSKTFCNCSSWLLHRSTEYFRLLH